MELKEALNALDYKITGGSEHMWKCYGENSRYLDFESDFAYASLIFDSKDQTIYCAELNSKDHAHAYRWLNPSFKDNYLNECEEKGVNYRNAWDSKEWTDLETSSDWLEKAKAIIQGEPFDTRVVVPLDLDDDTLYKLFMLAHENDVTLNKMVEIVLQKAIDHHKELNDRTIS